MNTFLTIRTPNRADALFRATAALALILWGLSVGLAAAHLQHSEAAHLLTVWWPAPFAVYALVGFATSGKNAWRDGTAFWCGLMLVASVAILAAHVSIGRVDVGTMVWAAVLVLAGILVLRPERW